MLVPSAVNLQVPIVGYRVLGREQLRIMLTVIIAKRSYLNISVQAKGTKIIETANFQINLFLQCENVIFPEN